MKPETNEKLQIWSKKLAVPFEELLGRLNKKIEETKQLHPGKDEDFIETRARRSLYVESKSELLSPAVPVELYVLGVSTMWDQTYRSRASAIEMWNRNPEEALKLGKVNLQGQPIDDRTTLRDGRPNPWYGKVLQPVLTREIAGLLKTGKFAVLRLIGNLAKETLFVNGNTYSIKMVVTKENPKSVYGNIFAGGRIVQVPLWEELKVLTPYDVLHSFPQELKAIPLATLMKHHNEVQAKDDRSMVIVEGTVMYVAADPTQYGSRMIVIDDTEDIEAEGTTLFAHEDIPIDFGPETVIAAIGRTATGPGWNRETRTVDLTVERISLNVISLHVDMSTKTAPIAVPAVAATEIH